MPKVHIPHRIPAESRLARILDAGHATSEDVDRLIVEHHREGRVDLEAVVSAALGDHEPPWTEHISGTLQLAVEDENGEPTGEIIDVAIVDGIADVPDEHLEHALRGVHGAHLVGEN